MGRVRLISFEAWRLLPVLSQEQEPAADGGTSSSQEVRLEKEGLAWGL
jgi:hypothetical protein